MKKKIVIYLVINYPCVKLFNSKIYEYEYFKVKNLIKL